MDENRDSDNHWQIIKEKLFIKETSEPSAGFSGRVMDRIRALESASRRTLIPVQWFAPVMGVAAIVLLAIIPAQELLSAEALIMEDGGQNDEILSLVTEEA